MSHSLKSLLKLSALGVSMGVLVGCAAQGDDAETRQMVEDAQAQASEALDVANEARETALEAEGTAKAAEYKANRNEERIEELDEKIDRMFEESMQK
ncbi:Lpp/OprI family alanine-zipper lipoprotein [Aquisalimonas asiatica]|uniref:Lipoprotein n=1 Tax=Aquisalimonas asiatica TaxID=406100 RepID=A0A1H8QG64_9GAMM|nr:Lpp/OprI family alanine-zipper lipoprotein [Aquisalimonas asiatica]SEO53229.1 hypothetical protein SAMN04488052_101568 [Aquisalimonas asiatica]